MVLFYSMIIEIHIPKDLISVLRKYKQKNCQVIILSDCNTEFINCVIKANNISDLFNRIITNPGYYDANGILHVSSYHNIEQPHNCQLCPCNLCKGFVVDSLNINNYQHVYYIGDGNNDVCPSLHLRSIDKVCARKESNLDRRIKKSQSRKCEYECWKDYEELSKILDKDVKSHQLQTE